MQVGLKTAAESFACESRCGESQMSSESGNCPELIIVIKGHSDDRGLHEYGQELGL